jgi:multidrug efflux pump subunit AcrA (membrane-fusion protein)
MLHKHPTLYVAIAGLTVMGVLVARLNCKQALSENVAIGVPEAGLVMTVHVQVWDRVKAGEPLFMLDGRELLAQLGVNEANGAVAPHSDSLKPPADRW